MSNNKIETNVVKPEIKFFENETEFIILDSQWETQLDEKIVEIENYMKNNNGKGKSEGEKDELYKNAQGLWREYASTLSNTKYNFFLNRKQYKFLTDLILQKMEYDVNTVFFAIELTNLLGQMKEDSRYKNDEDLIGFPVDATEITYIYHLISKHKVKGLTTNSYLFTQVLIRIGDISKVFSYYDTSGKNLSTEIQNWVVTFEEGVTTENVETVEGEVVE